MIRHRIFAMTDKTEATNWWGWDWTYEDRAALLDAAEHFANTCRSVVSINTVLADGARNDEQPFYTVIVWYQD